MAGALFLGIQIELGDEQGPDQVDPALSTGEKILPDRLDQGRIQQRLPVQPLGGEQVLCQRPERPAQPIAAGMPKPCFGRSHNVRGT